MQYIRERWHNGSLYPLPPKVIAWDTSLNSDVGTPFILAEFVEGVTAINNWFEPETYGSPVASFIFNATFFEMLMLSEPFAFHGALYFANDVDGVLAARPLYSDQSYGDKQKYLSEKYRIGPTVGREWYCGVYEQIPAPRGPCEFPLVHIRSCYCTKSHLGKNMQSFIRDAVNLQLKAVESGAAFQTPLIRASTKDRADIVRYLNMAMEIVDFIVPADPMFHRPALNHPDLALGNMIWRKDENGQLKGLQSIIDWQCAVVHPFAMQARPSEAFIYRGTTVKMSPDGNIPFPDDFDSLPPDVQEEIRLEHRLACRDRSFQICVNKLQDDRPESWRLPHARLLTDLVQAVLRAAADGPGYLRELLLETQERWDDIVALSAKPGSPCPIAFTDEEAEMIRAEVASTAKYERNVEEMSNTIGCLIDGWIPEHKYGIGKEMAKVLQKEWKEDEMGGPFPFMDGAWSPNLT